MDAAGKKVGFLSRSDYPYRMYMDAAGKKVALTRQIRLSISYVYGCSREESCIDSADQTIHIVCIWMQQGRKLDLLSRSDYPYRVFMDAAGKKAGLARQIRLSISYVYGCSREESCIDSADQTIHIVCIWMQQGRKLH